MDTHAIAALFDARAAGYVDDGWHRRYAQQFVEALPLRPGARVLDAGTGTGFAALAAIDRVGPEGFVVGVDVSTRMLAEARGLIAREGVANIELREGDTSTLAGFDDGSFDAVICSAGLLYMPVDRSLRRWHDLLVPGGLVAFSTMEADSPAPGRIFRECAATFGLHVEDPSEDLGHPDRCRRALEAAGFQDPIVIADTVPFDTINPTLAWEANSRSAAHCRVLALDPHQREALRETFIAALQRAVFEDPAATTRADVLFAMGRRM